MVLLKFVKICEFKTFLHLFCQSVVPLASSKQENYANYKKPIKRRRRTWKPVYCMMAAACCLNQLILLFTETLHVQGGQVCKYVTFYFW